MMEATDLMTVFKGVRFVCNLFGFVIFGMSKDEKGDTVICSSAKAKADSLCKFLVLYFVMKEMNVLMHLMIESFLQNLHQYE